jgi:hypothetical protein
VHIGLFNPVHLTFREKQIEESHGVTMTRVNPLKVTAFTSRQHAQVLHQLESPDISPDNPVSVSTDLIVNDDEGVPTHLTRLQTAQFDLSYLNQGEYQRDVTHFGILLL